MMENKEINKNLKHGYIFLSVIVLTVFAISLSIEIYLKGGFKLNIHLPIIENEPIRVITTQTDNSRILLEFQNITDGYNTKESSITIVAKTDIGNKAWINSKEVTSDDAGTFELKINLTVGNNDILIEAENSNGVKANKKITIIREEEKKEEPQPNQTITALKLHCSITNIQPSIGQTVSLDCSAKDQNSSPINGATGNAKINWQSGGQTIAFPNSQNGSMSVSFVVPSGNNGAIRGNVQVTKDGLTVTSNFSITVQ